MQAFSVERYFRGPPHTGCAVPGGKAMCDRPSTVGARETHDICGEDSKVVFLEDSQVIEDRGGEIDYPKMQKRTIDKYWLG